MYTHAHTQASMESAKEINLRRKQRNWRNEATTNHERFTYPQFRIPWERTLRVKSYGVKNNCRIENAS